jgi:hypothetical protein
MGCLDGDVRCLHSQNMLMCVFVHTAPTNLVVCTNPNANAYDTRSAAQCQQPSRHVSHSNMSLIPSPKRTAHALELPPTVCFFVPRHVGESVDPFPVDEVPPSFQEHLLVVLPIVHVGMFPRIHT